MCPSLIVCDQLPSQHKPMLARDFATNTHPCELNMVRPYLKAGSCWPPPKSVKNMSAITPSRVTRFIGLPSGTEE